MLIGCSRSTKVIVKQIFFSFQGRNQNKIRIDTICTHRKIMSEVRNDHAWKNYYSEAISVVKFSSQVFKVFMLTINKKRKNKFLRLVSWFVSSKKVRLSVHKLRLLPGFIFYIIRQANLYIFHSRINHKSRLFHRTLFGNRSMFIQFNFVGATKSISF